MSFLPTDPPAGSDSATPADPPTYLDEPAGGSEPPTHLDEPTGHPTPADPPTHLDEPTGGPTGEPPTHLDGQRGAGWSDPSRLPPVLAQRFPDARPHQAGTQAYTFRATLDGQQVVLRVARAGVALAADVDLTSIRSPHLCRVLETGCADGADYQVLVYVPGQTLAEHLARSGTLIDEERRAFVREIAEALAALGREDIVHRDLKPANIVVTTASDGLHFVVVDYGLARRAEHTMEEFAMGNTPIYAEPLAFLGSVSRQCDWWSFGMIVAEAILGHHPLADADQNAVGMSIIYRLFDLTGITDARWSLLVHGLLTPNHEVRWGVDEVSSWLAGGSPDVADAPAFPVPPGATVAATAPFRFAGVEYRADPRRLADAFGQRWDEAARVLGSPVSRQALARWARQFDDSDLLAALDAVGQGTRSLDQDLMVVIGALYRAPRAAQRGAGPTWYRGRQVGFHELHVLSQEALLDADALAGTEGRAADLVDRPALYQAAELLDGDLAVLAEVAGPGSPVERVWRHLDAGRRFVDQWTNDLSVRRERWELLLWSIRLLACLTGPQQAVALHEDATEAARHRRDLRWLVGPRTASAHHLVATIRGRRS